MTINSVCRASYLRNHTSNDCHLWFTCVKWWYLQIDIFSIFFKFWFFGLLVGWKVKKWSKMTKNYVCCSTYLRKHTSYDCDFSCTFVRNHKSWSQEPDIIWSSFVIHKCVKWWYLQQFFSFFQNSGFSGFYGLGVKE